MPRKNLAGHISTKKTDQMSAIPGREKEMVENNAGGVVFKVSDMDVVKRFLIIGTEGNTYYVNERDATKDNAGTIIKLIKSGHGKEVLDEAIRVSDEGLAKNNNYAILVLALVITYASDEIKSYAVKNVSKICRIGTHILTLVSYIKELRGWGTIVKALFNEWFKNHTTSQLAFQMLKYQNRNGVEMRDVLRLNHVKPIDNDQKLLFNYITGGSKKYESLFPLKEFPKDLKIIEGFEKAKEAKNEKEIIKIITDYKLPREMIPTEFTNKANVQKAMLPNLGLTAIIRNLGSFTASGLLETANFDDVNFIVDSITNKEYLQKSRIHPLQVLDALVTYQQGHGIKGNLYWNPVAKIISALDVAFYESFKNIVPTGKRIMLALDVSGSMGSPANGCNLQSRQVTAAMAMVTARTERNYMFTCFADYFRELEITPDMKLEAVMEKVYRQDFGSTDCSLPMIAAQSKNWNFDAFCVYTDNETYAGNIQPCQALVKYRKHSGISDAKLIVCATTSTRFSIADPKDKNMIDIAGFSADTPSVISQFIRGEI